jgi:integrase/recombinase XerD
MEEIVEHFLDYLTKQSRSAHTISAYGCDVYQFVSFLRSRLQGDVDWGRVDEKDIEAFLEYLQGRKYAHLTISRKLSAVRAFFLFLQDKRIVRENPSARVPDRKFARICAPRMTAQEAEKVISQVDLGTPKGIRDAAILRLIYVGGLRASEVTSIDLSDLDVEGKTLYVPLTGKAISLDERTLEAMKAYVDKARPALGHGKKADALFLNARGGRLTRQGLWVVFKHYARSAGLPSHVTLRSLGKVMG